MKRHEIILPAKSKSQTKAGSGKEGRTARSKDREEHAKARFEEQPAEVERDRAVAEVWQRVAEEIVEANVRTKGRRAEAFTKGKDESAASIGLLQPGDVFENLSNEEVKLKLPGPNLIVPATIPRESQPEETREPRRGKTSAVWAGLDRRGPPAGIELYRRQRQAALRNADTRDFVPAITSEPGSPTPSP